jgi:hypothetical protein
VQFENYSELLLNFILRITLAIVYFLEWTCLFLKVLKNFKYVGLRNASDWYIPVYLSFSLSLMLVLVAANLQFLSNYLYISLVIIGIFFLWFVSNLPYNHSIHTAGEIVNLIMVMFFLMWSVLRKFDEDASKEENEILITFLLCLLMLAAVLLAIARLIFELRRMCREKLKKIEKS